MTLYLRLKYKLENHIYKILESIVMSDIDWILRFIGLSLFYKWILSWGGAKVLEGVLSVFTFGWFSFDWNTEQLRFYVLLLWIGSSVWFLIGLFYPELRTMRFGRSILH